MNRKNGFTLIEMLIALSIVITMLLLVVPISLSTLETAKEKQFFKTLEFDVLYIQSTTDGDELTRIKFYDDHYGIIKGTHQSVTRRYYPEGVTFYDRANKYITFEGRGSIRNPRKIEIHTKHGTYLMTFPFGKGRYYIEKE